MADVDKIAKELSQLSIREAQALRRMIEKFDAAWKEIEEFVNSQALGGKSFDETKSATSEFGDSVSHWVIEADEAVEEAVQIIRITPENVKRPDEKDGSMFGFGIIKRR